MSTQSSMQAVLGDTDVVVGSVILQLATIYRTVLEHLGQAVENSADAGMKICWVVFEEMRVSIVDDGGSMLPFIKAEDKVILADYFKLARSGGAEFLNRDIRAEISPLSLRSLEWMMKYIALSPKLPTTGARGTKGIGSLAWLGYGTQAVYYARPSMELARSYWGAQTTKELSVYKLVPPTEEQLRANNVTHEISRMADPLKDPWGRELAHGTRLEVTGIRPDALDNFRHTGLVAAYLSSRFGDDLAKHRFKIVIVDRLTEEGKKVAGGKEITIEPPVYQGALVLKEDITLRDEKATFEVELHYNSGSRGKGPEFRRKGSAVEDLVAAFPELNQPLWKALSGYIDFPDLPDTVAPWNAQKTVLQASAARAHFLKKLLELEKRIEEKVSDIEDRERKRNSDKYQRQVSEAVQQALQQVDVFKGQVKGVVIPVKKPSKKAKKRPAYNVEVAVLDEHDRGVPNITVELIHRGTTLSALVTGVTGNLQFGRVKFGKYTLKMHVPKGFDANITELHITLDAKESGCRKVFHLKTHLPFQGGKETIGGQIQVWIHPLPDPKQLFSAARLKVGVIEINRIAEPISSAMDSNDRASLDAIVAACCSAAIAAHAVKEKKIPSDDFNFVLQYQTILMTEILSVLRGTAKRSKKKKVRK